jgi:copper homeostasis protein
LESLNEAISAEKKGANQIELCRNLIDDGLTPDYKLVRTVINSVLIPVKIMVRPRKGNFIYSDEEMVQIKDQISTFKSIGVTQIVFGALNKHRVVDIDHTKRAIEWSYPMQITFHKAIDYSNNFFDDIESLINLGGIDSILTSGKASTAKAGSSILREAIKNYGEDIKIISAGKITDKNLNNIHRLINGKYYHGKNILGNLS